MRKKHIFPAVIILGLLFFISNTNTAKSASLDNKIIGGNCLYEEYGGVCKILNLYFNPEKSDGKLVGFKFEPYLKLDATAIELLRKRDFIDTKQEETVNNFVPDDWNQHDKNQLEIGDNVSCTLRIVTSGTCTPIIFSMQEILKNPDAYSDLQSRQIIINILLPVLLILLMVIIIFSVHKRRKRRKRKKSKKLRK